MVGSPWLFDNQTNWLSLGTQRRDPRIHLQQWAYRNGWANPVEAEPKHMPCGAPVAVVNIQQMTRFLSSFLGCSPISRMVLWMVGYDSYDPKPYRKSELIPTASQWKWTQRSVSKVHSTPCCSNQQLVVVGSTAPSAPCGMTATACVPERLSADICAAHFGSSRTRFWPGFGPQLWWRGKPYQRGLQTNSSRCLRICNAPGKQHYLTILNNT